MGTSKLGAVREEMAVFSILWYLLQLATRPRSLGVTIRLLTVMQVGSWE